MSDFGPKMETAHEWRSVRHKNRSILSGTAEKMKRLKSRQFDNSIGNLQKTKHTVFHMLSFYNKYNIKEYSTMSRRQNTSGPPITTGKTQPTLKYTRIMKTH